MSIELSAGLTSIVNQAVVPKAAQIKQHGIKQHGGDLSGQLYASWWWLHSRYMNHDAHLTASVVR